MSSSVLKKLESKGAPSTIKTASSNPIATLSQNAVPTSLWSSTRPLNDAGRQTEVNEDLCDGDDDCRLAHDPVVPWPEQAHESHQEHDPGDLGGDRNDDPPANPAGHLRPKGCARIRTCVAHSHVGPTPLVFAD